MAEAEMGKSPFSGIREVREATLVLAFFLGVATIAAAVLLGRKYSFFLSFLGFSVFMTLLWRKAPRPWVFLLSISAATPITVSKQQFTCNLIFALWFALLNIRDLFRLPKWIYLSSALALLGIITSMTNWMSGDVLRCIMQQGAFAYNLFLGPFLILPVAYLKMRQSRNHAANLKGLLFCLIIPSTVLLVSAKLLGVVANEWEASLHVGSLPEGFLQYRLGKVIVNFLRTEIGFILAALICASTAVAVSRVRWGYRLLAGACLASNAFLLIATGSFGSGFACLCGLSAIFLVQFRFSVINALFSAVAICCMLFLTYSLAPASVKEYIGKRYELRVVKADKDRLELWSRATEQLLQHPEGVGLTFSVGDRVKTFIHNDYLVYAVSYGVIGGLGYLLLVIGLLFSFFQRPKSALSDPAALAIYLAGLGVIVALALNSMTDHSNENRWYFNVIWSLIWYCYFCSRAPARTVALADLDTLPLPDYAFEGECRLERGGDSCRISRCLRRNGSCTAGPADASTSVPIAPIRS